MATALKDPLPTFLRGARTHKAAKLCKTPSLEGVARLVKVLIFPICSLLAVSVFLHFIQLLRTNSAPCALATGTVFVIHRETLISSTSGIDLDKDFYLIVLIVDQCLVALFLDLIHFDLFCDHRFGFKFSCEQISLLLSFANRRSHQKLWHR